MDEAEQSFHPKWMMILVLNTQTGELTGVGGKICRRQLKVGEVRRLAASKLYDPGATLGNFSNKILVRAGINRESASPMQILELYCAVANGGKVSTSPASRRLMSIIEAKHLRQLLEQNILKGDGLLLARVQGVRIAGCAGHSRSTSDERATSSFVGFYPANHPRHVCLVLAEAAKVLPKYNRGALVAAPIFSRIAEYCPR
jgi:hypothetical protein